MAYQIEIELPGLPRRPNQLNRRHYRAFTKEKNYWLRLVGFAVCRTRPKKPLKKATVACTRYSSVAPDYDGLVGSFKFVMDALVACRVLSDDSMKVIGMPDFRWQHCPGKEGKIKIVVKEVLTRIQESVR